MIDIRTRALPYVALAVIGLAAWYWSGSSPAVASAPSHSTKHTNSSVASDYLESDFTARFDPPKSKLRDVFTPLIKSSEGAVAAERKGPDLMRMPATIASGDPNWLYTGFAEIDGHRSALFENSSTHQSNMVRLGEPWKQGRVVDISADKVLIRDESGANLVVTRYYAPAASPTVSPSVSPTAPGPSAHPAGLAPVNPGSAIQGPIGGDFGIQPLPGVMRRRMMRR